MSPPQFAFLSSVRVISDPCHRLRPWKLYVDMGNHPQAVYPRGSTQTMHKLREYALGVTIVRHSSLSTPPRRELDLQLCCGMMIRTLAPKPAPPTPPYLFLNTKDTDTYTCLPVAVVSAKKNMYFELFCVPIIPMSSKHVWVCNMCQWRVPLQQGYVLASL